MKTITHADGSTTTVADDALVLVGEYDRAVEAIGGYVVDVHRTDGSTVTVIAWDVRYRTDLGSYIAGSEFDEETGKLRCDAAGNLLDEVIVPLADVAQVEVF